MIAQFRHRISARTHVVQPTLQRTSRLTVTLLICAVLCFCALSGMPAHATGDSVRDGATVIAVPERATAVWIDIEPASAGAQFSTAHVRSATGTQVVQSVQFAGTDYGSTAVVPLSGEHTVQLGLSGAGIACSGECRVPTLIVTFVDHTGAILSNVAVSPLILRPADAAGVSWVAGADDTDASGGSPADPQSNSDAGVAGGDDAQATESLARSGAPDLGASVVLGVSVVALVSAGVLLLHARRTDRPNEIGSGSNQKLAEGDGHE